ncbi:MAG: hypothetical protein GDA51_14080 [Ekhidna sp.]|nr:hypothetical protein [Ekhidna sp.]
MVNAIYTYKIFKNSIYGKIKELKDLNDNWNGENSPAPSEQTIKLAKKAASCLINQGSIVNFSYPLKNGDIQLEGDNDAIEYEVHLDGTVYKLSYDRMLSFFRSMILPVSISLRHLLMTSCLSGRLRSVERNLLTRASSI